MRPRVYPGVYRHWKGQHYRVFGMARDEAEGLFMRTEIHGSEVIMPVAERNLVVYVPLYYDAERRDWDSHDFQTRPYHDFTAMVHIHKLHGEGLEAFDIGTRCLEYKHRYEDHRTNKDFCPHQLTVIKRFVKEPFPA